MPAKPTLRSTISDASRSGVAVQRHRISLEDANRIKAAEKIGHNEAVRVLLSILFKRSA